MVSQTTSTLETEAILLNTLTACRRSMYSERTWSLVFNLYQVFLLYQRTLKRKGEEGVYAIVGIAVMDMAPNRWMFMLTLE